MQFRIDINASVVADLMAKFGINDHKYFGISVKVLEYTAGISETLHLEGMAVNHEIPSRVIRRLGKQHVMPLRDEVMRGDLFGDVTLKL